MRKAFSALITIILLAASLAACTHNNGDIGPWFGAWKVEAITVDGTQSPNYEGNLFFEFQNKVIKMSLIDDLHSSNDIYGNWSEHDGTMHLDFTDDRWQPFAVTGLPSQCDLKVGKMHGGKVTLSWTNPANGSTTEFQLKKWH